MNGVVLLVGGLLLVAVIKLIIDRNWIGLLEFGDDLRSV